MGFGEGGNAQRWLVLSLCAAHARRRFVMHERGSFRGIWERGHDKDVPERASAGRETGEDRDRGERGGGGKGKHAEHDREGREGARCRCGEKDEKKREAQGPGGNGGRGGEGARSSPRVAVLGLVVLLSPEEELVAWAGGDGGVSDAWARPTVGKVHGARGKGGGGKGRRGREGTHDVRLWCMDFVVLPPQRLSLCGGTQGSSQGSASARPACIARGSRAERGVRGESDARCRFLATRLRSGGA